MLKIKASYGSQGNDNIADIYETPRYTNTYDIVNSSGHPASVPKVLGNKDITWETNGNRKYGFYTGHYFNEYEEAYKNMEKRAKDLLVQNLCRNKNFLRKYKKNQDRLVR